MSVLASPAGITATGGLMMTGAMGNGRPERQLQIAAEQARQCKTVAALANVALNSVEGDHGAVLRVAAGIGSAFALLGNREDLHHDDNGQQADHHADHDFNQAEARLAGTPSAGFCFHESFLT